MDCNSKMEVKNMNVRVIMPLTSPLHVMHATTTSNFKQCYSPNSLENGMEVISSTKATVRTSNCLEATFNCTSLLLGLGLLSSPYAVAQAGWAGVAICVALAAANAYAAQLLVRCQRQSGCGTYQEVTQAAVGWRTCLLVDLLFYVEVVGSLLGYCISIADNLACIFPSFTASLPGLSPRNLLLLLACLSVLPTVWMRDLGSLAFTSLWSVAAAVLLVVVVLAAASADRIGFHHPIPLANLHGAPIATGLYAFAFSGTTVFPNVYKSMKDPSKFTQVLLCSFGITAFFVLGLGLAGAAMFGKATASQVTLSMPAHRITTKIVLWATVLTPLLKFALVLAPVSEAMDEKLAEKLKHQSPRLQWAIATLARSSVMAIVVIVSMLLPYFNYVVALMGSSVTIIICLIFPCVFYVKICRDQLTRTSLALMALTTVFAIISAVCGTIISFHGLVESKTHHSV